MLGAYANLYKRESWSAVSLEATDPNAGEFKYVQFSDHQIAPNKAAHFHIFFGGESQEALYKELEIGLLTTQVTYPDSKLRRKCWHINQLEKEPVGSFFDSNRNLSNC